MAISFVFYELRLAKEPTGGPSSCGFILPNLSRSKTWLQNCLNAISLYCDKWKLKINPQKKKKKIPETPKEIYWHQIQHRQCVSIEIVKEYTSLGTRLTPTGNALLWS